VVNSSSQTPFPEVEARLALPVLPKSESDYGPVESRPDGAAGVVAVDAPLVGDGADDVQAMVPSGVDHPWFERRSLVCVSLEVSG